MAETVEVDNLDQKHNVVGNAEYIEADGINFLFEAVVDDGLQARKQTLFRSCSCAVVGMVDRLCWQDEGCRP